MQMLYAHRYVRERFGLTPQIAWLPDTFGFPNTLPTLLAHAGIPYFGTTKLQWNDTNRFPYPQFRWRGPDGSEIVSAMLASYEGAPSVQRLEKARERREPVVVGYGDGGGGPTCEHLAQASIGRTLGTATRVVRTRCGRISSGLRRRALSRISPRYLYDASRRQGEERAVRAPSAGRAGAARVVHRGARAAGDRAATARRTRRRVAHDALQSIPRRPCRRVRAGGVRRSRRAVRTRERLAGTGRKLDRCDAAASARAERGRCLRARAERRRRDRAR